MTGNVEMPHALLINPPVYDFALYDLFHKPLGLMHIGRWLEEAGFGVEIVDALDVNDEPSQAILGMPRRLSNGTGHFFKQAVKFPAIEAAVKRKYSRYGILTESFERRVAATHPEIVLITSGMTYWYPGVVEAVRTVRKLHPGVPLVVGGVYATLLPEHCKRVAEPDHVVCGEPWDALKVILSTYNLPVPKVEPGARTLLKKDVWRGAGALRLNRGCPLHCDYCASPLLEPEFRPGDVDESLVAIREVAQRCDISTFAFYDDALLFEKEATFIPFLEKIIEGDLNLAFYLPNAVHLGMLDFKTATLMVKAGFKEVRLGYESASVSFHEHHDAKVGVGDLEEAVRMLRDAGFDGNQITAYILAGLPGQRAQEIEITVRHAASIGIRASIAEYSPVPGTRLWKASVAESRFSIVEEPLFQNNSIMPLQWSGFTTDDLQRLKDLSRKLSPARR